MPGRGISAGQSSQLKYDELVRSWRRRKRRMFATVGLICASVMVSSFFAAGRWPAAAWIFGLLAGVAFAFFLMAWWSPPGWIENWQSGAWGEQATAKALRSLEKDGWVVLHDLPAGRGNVDHIVVGPGGVYLLDSKRLDGAVSVDEHGVMVRRLDDHDLTYRHTGSTHLLSLARQTHHRVLANSRIKTWVTPVMVLWADFPQRIAEDRCVYAHGDELVGWLRSRPQTIAPIRVQQVAAVVRAAWESDTTATSG